MIALSSGVSSANSTKPTAGDTAAAKGVAPGNDILTALIQQMLAGGTPQMQQDKATKNSEIATAQNNRSGYSKEAAFGDAQGLIAQTMRQVLEKLMPSINSASLGAGSSASSMRALLVQKAAENAAQSASAQGLEAAVKYGGVSNQFTDAIARLLSIQDPSASLAIQAASNMKASPTGGGGGGGVGSMGNNLPYEPYPMRTATNQGAANLPINMPSGGMKYFGPLEDTTPTNIVGTTEDTLRELAGDTRFRGYTF